MIKRFFISFLLVFIFCFAGYAKDLNPRHGTLKRGLPAPRGIQPRQDGLDLAKRWNISKDTADRCVLLLDSSIQGYEWTAETWPDASGNGNDFQWHTGSQQPTLQRESGRMPNIAILDGTDDRMVHKNFDSDLDTDGDPQFGTSYFKLDMANGTIDVPGLTDAGLFGLESLEDDLFDANAYLTGIGGWVKYGNNTVTTLSGENGVYITYVDNSNGAYLHLRDSKDLTSDLTVGQLYKFSCQWKVNTGSVHTYFARDGEGYSNIGDYDITNTEYESYTLYFIASTTNVDYIIFTQMHAGEIVYIKDMALQAVNPHGPAQFGLSGTTYVVLAYDSGDSVWGGYTGLGRGRCVPFELGDNLLTNGGFESLSGVSDFEGWSESAPGNSYISGTSTVYSGSAGVSVYGNASAAPYIGQGKTVEPNASYLVEFWTRGDGSYAGRYGIWDTTNSQWIHSALVTTGVAGTGYTGVSVYFTAPSNCVSAGPYFYSDGGNAHNFWIDEVSMKKVLSPGTSGASIFANQNCTTGGSVWQTEGFNPNDVDKIVAYPASLNLTGDQTWIVILKPDDGQPSANDSIMGRFEVGSNLNQRSLVLRVQTDGRVRVIRSTNGDSTSSLYSDGAVFSDGSQDNYTFLALTRDSSTQRLYVNGNENNSIATGTIFDSDTFFTLGANWSNRVLNSAFAGRIASVIIFDTALTAQEMENVYISEMAYKNLL